ncbi:hypothetical protein ACG74X_18305 [Marivita sp. S0852]|uniref:hypothetical protein n=1 Tax=Marivita sp. S0852 TaxID=3373893 RepID=UPI0039823F79
MMRIFFIILCLGFVAACESGGGDVLVTPEETEPDTGGGGDDETPIDSDGRTPELPPGTTNPTPDTSIVRREPLDDETGGGFARNIEYRNDQGQDEFVVDNIAFDGDNVYTRGDPVTGIAQLGSFAVYEGKEETSDPVTGASLNTFTYRAVYGRSVTGQTEFAIVRSGSYIDYGFGGFVYQRNGFDNDGNVVQLVLPNEGDASYRGDYAGIRVFSGRGGLEFVQGDAELRIDFKDFNNGQRGVALFVDNRRLFDSQGNDITQEYLTALSTAGAEGGGLFGDLNIDEEGGSGASVIVETDEDGNPVLPRIRPVISPDDADANGEITGELRELADFDNGSTQATGEGTYYAIISGEDAGEVVGVLVLEGSDPRVSGTNFQETGGFVVYRQ